MKDEKPHTYALILNGIYIMSIDYPDDKEIGVADE
jgi:hypothetical protein